MVSNIWAQNYFVFFSENQARFKIFGARFTITTRTRIRQQKMTTLVEEIKQDSKAQNASFEKRSAALLIELLEKNSISFEIEMLEKVYVIAFDSIKVAVVIEESGKYIINDCREKLKQTWESDVEKVLTMIQTIFSNENKSI